MVLLCPVIWPYPGCVCRWSTDRTYGLNVAGMADFLCSSSDTNRTQDEKNDVKSVCLVCLLYFE
jgi:hypothetical protein